MNTLLWVLAGATMGWLAFSMLGLNGGWGLAVSLIIGVMGGVFGGKMVAPMIFGATAPEGMAIAALFVAAAVAAGSLAIANIIHNRMEP